MMFRWSIFHENITFETGITHDVVRFPIFAIVEWWLSFN